MAVMTAGVFLSGLRDLAAAYRPAARPPV